MTQIDVPKALQPTDQDIHKLVFASVHIGTKNSDKLMEPYIWRRRSDNTYVLNLGKTWEKLILAARVIVAVENPKDVIAISARPYGQRAVLKFAQYTGAQSIAGRFTPGTFTNQITKQFREPRLLLVTDPRTDSQAVHEASYVNVPVIAFADSDSPLQYVDIAIPANNKGRLSIGLLYWLLAREVLRLRGTISRVDEWDVPVDLFFYREPDEIEKEEEKPATFAAEAEIAEPAPIAPGIEDFGAGGMAGVVPAYGEPVSASWDGAGAAPVDPAGASWDQPADTAGWTN
ncbi:hypothetical protein NSK_008376 [Nannochloropsis salina CCMP1776]|uniref:Small ribosomal subunit protein uS2 n=1 Tax=Nannochloropsis salina CCMP1776 TaxID=1027361 RepID=A0A4D9CRS5_9STRA|nr:hypothetical protein NSK_008376 [Nannochloropsis salina CCMP1776]|eukprot:TFJ80233.1 hypothetical protein NSK_008376 [Nannochloropsis salina CCMP1776]